DRDVLKQLSGVPRQVLIETVSAEVGLTGDLQFGVEYAIANQGIGSVIGSPTSSSSTPATPSATDTTSTTGTTSTPATSGGLVDKGGVPGIANAPLLQAAKIGGHVSDTGLFSFITDRKQFLALIRALAARSQLNILSTPHV